MDKKVINLTKDEDVQRWKEIKLADQNRLGNPDIGDVGLLRNMMNLYEEEKVNIEDE